MKLRNATLIMTILFLAAVVATAGYAYFSATIELNGNVNAIISTAGNKPAFTSEVNGEINLNVNIQDLTNENIGNEVANSNSTINVSLLAGSNNGNVTCTYDIEFVWDGDAYNSTVSLPYTPEKAEVDEEDELQDEVMETETKQYDFELSLQGKSSQTGSEVSESNSGLTETNLDKLQWKDGNTNKIATVVKGASITNNSDSAATNVTWTFELKFYVLPTPQNQLIRKDFKGHLVVANVIC